MAHYSLQTFRRSLLATFFILTLGVQAFGTDEGRRGQDLDKKGTSVSLPDPGSYSILQLKESPSAWDLFLRTQAVLKHLGISPQPSYENQIKLSAKKQAKNGIDKILRYFDVHNEFARFSVIVEGSSPTLQVFQDFDSKQVSDFEVELASQPEQPYVSRPTNKLTSRPLLGLRIALDPGHMGGDLWDDRTGKVVYEFKGHQGRKVSEGVINLQTSLLLKQKLEKLGATVLITRETLNPVTTVKWENLNVSDYAPGEILQSTLSPWFLELIQSAAPGVQLDQAVDHNPQIKRAYSQTKRDDYFLLIADLDARTRMIAAFHPDITLVIHHDTSDPDDDPTGLSKGHDYTKTYVAGGFEQTEFADRKHRRDFALHVLNPTEWENSVKLSHEIVGSMKRNLGLLPDRGLFGSAVEIEPGVLARDLNLTRTINGTILSFVECLYYNDPSEFFAYLKPDHQMIIGGKKTFYSNRLVQVANALEEGVLNFVTTSLPPSPSRH